MVRNVPPSLLSLATITYPRQQVEVTGAFQSVSRADQSEVAAVNKLSTSKRPIRPDCLRFRT